MARYRGPQTKIARKFGEEIFGYDKYFQRRKYAPGQHGPSKRRKQQSEYAIQLTEKQKAKYTYGVLERQFESCYNYWKLDWIIQFIEWDLQILVVKQDK
jgi:small subunit ribosomal protein S4